MEQGLQAETPSLDLIKHNRNKSRFCGTWSVVGQINHDGKIFYHHFRLGCKRWTCPKCGPKKAKRVRRAISERATERGLNKFLTLTLNPRSCSPEQSIDYIRECWNKFRTTLKRKYKKPLSFIGVLELQKSGYAHLHVLLDRFISQKWISTSWQAIGGGKIVFIETVDVHRIGAYLSKYLTKALLVTETKTRQRRYTTSRDIHLFVKQPKGAWKLVKSSLDVVNAWAGGKSINEVFDQEGNLQTFQTLEAIFT